MLPATIAIGRKLCSLQAKQKRCSDLNAECVIKNLDKKVRRVSAARCRYLVVFSRLCVCVTAEL